MEKNQIKLRAIIKSVRAKIDKRINRLKTKLGLVKNQKKELVEIELKLRSMRAIATRIRDEDLNDREQEELEKKFSILQQEVKELDTKEILNVY